MKRSRRQVTRLLLSAAVLLYVVVFSVLGIARYNTFHATTFDLGIMTQVVWNTAHGRWFETSLGRATNVELIGSYLGNHVRPIRPPAGQLADVLAYVTDLVDQNQPCWP